MGTFNASLKTPGDMKGLPATLRVDQGRLHIAAGDTPIGDWSREEIALEPIAGGFRLKVEGEMLLVEMNEVEAFESELMPSTRKEKRGGRTEHRPATTATKIKAPRSKNKAPRTKTRPTPGRAPKKPKEERKQSRLDVVLDKAEKRWGSLLPSWVFTKAVAYAAIAFVAATVFFPGVISVLVLVAGLALVLLGAVAFSDSVLASKWLPGRARPDHALIAGVAMLLLGILIRLLVRL